MKANFAILALLCVAFHIGAEGLNCYEDDGSHRNEVTCKEGNECYLERNGNAPPQAHGCADEEVVEHCKDDPRCTSCDTDLCNTLQCYSSEEKKQVGCTARDEMCITDRSTDEKKCGRCEGNDECEQCNEDMCNRPPLNCFDSANKVVPCEDKQGDRREKCITIVEDGRAMEKKCGTCHKWDVDTLHKESETCEECDSDECNVKPVQPLNCYNAADQLTKCKDMHIKDTVLNRIVDKKCGICPDPKKPEEDFRQQQMKPNEKCEECHSDGCNKEPVKLLNCYNATNQANVCQSPIDNCITIMDKVSKRAVDKKCGTCDNWRKQEAPREQRESETCKECNKDKYNEKLTVKFMTCYNNTNKVQQCENVKDYCYTKKKDFNGFALVQERGCGRCDTNDKESIPCFQNRCNNGTIEDKLECYKVDDNLQKTVESCELHGLKCIVNYTKTSNNDWIIGRGCGLCPTELAPDEICHQCDYSKCNDFYWPQCKAGAGNGAGDFFVDKECKQNLKLNKDMKVTATCIKQQVEGITYKDCGSCGAFVDYSVTKIPNLPKDANINKCNECVSTEGDESGKLCNGAILANQMPVPFWMLLVICAFTPWLL